MAPRRVDPGVGEVTVLPIEVEEFLTWLVTERGRAVNTVAAYRRDLRDYCAWLTHHGLVLVGVEEQHLGAWSDELRTLPLAPATVARKTVAVRSLHRFLVAEGLACDDPSGALAPGRVPAGLPKALSEAEIGRLFDSVVGEDPVSCRDRALLEILYGTGARISEVVGLSLSDLDLDAGLVRVLGKGSKERIVPLGSMVRQALLAWLAEDARGVLLRAGKGGRSDTDAVLLNQRGRRLSRQGAWGIVRSRALAAGVHGPLSPHVLRHSCATHMLDHGADIRAVQELLGHASISTTQVYTKVAPERLRRVFDAAHPRARLA